MPNDLEDTVFGPLFRSLQGEGDTGVKPDEPEEESPPRGSPSPS